MEVDALAALDLIGAIYDAVIEPERWNDTLDLIRKHFQFQIAMIGISGLPGGISIQASSNVPEPYATTVLDYGSGAIDLWGGPEAIARMPLEEPLQHSRCVPASMWIGKPFYEYWVKPQGLVDQLVLILERSPRMIATLGLGVHKTMPPISEAQIEGLRVIAPHLRRAAIISGLLEWRSEAAASFEATLSALSSAVVLVGEGLGIAWANERAERMLREGDPIARSFGRLTLPGELAPGQLERAVAAAMADEGALPQASGIAVRRKDGAGSVIHVLPLKKRAAKASLRGVAAVFVTEPDSDLNLPLEALRMLYGLQPAETRVFELIVHGRSGREIAKALGIAPSTVKTHTLRVFDKLGVRSRSQLVKLARDASLGTAS